MIKKKYLMILSIAVVSVLFGSLFVGNVLLAQSGGEYDPWIDINEDGIIDVNDLASMSQTYGTSGDPTKNVNVTNWPVERELFPENLILRATRWLVPARHELIDETTTYPFPRVRIEYDSVSTTLSTTTTLIYNNTFIYQKIPTNAYRILGMPTASLTYNVTNSPSATINFLFYAYLGKISMGGEWTELVLLGYQGLSHSGANTDFQTKVSLTPWIDPVAIMLDAYERLGIRILVYGQTAPTTDLTLEILFGKDTDEFLVDIPIVKNP